MLPVLPDSTSTILLIYSQEPSHWCYDQDHFTLYSWWSAAVQKLSYSGAVNNTSWGKQFIFRERLLVLFSYSLWQQILIQWKRSSAYEFCERFTAYTLHGFLEGSRNNAEGYNSWRKPDCYYEDIAVTYQNKGENRRRIGCKDWWSSSEPRYTGSKKPVAEEIQ